METSTLDAIRPSLRRAGHAFQSAVAFKGQQHALAPDAFIFWHGADRT